LARNTKFELGRRFSPETYDNTTTSICCHNPHVSPPNQHAIVHHCVVPLHPAAPGLRCRARGPCCPGSCQERPNQVSRPAVDTVCFDGSVPFNTCACEAVQSRRARSSCPRAPRLSVRHVRLSYDACLPGQSPRSSLSASHVFYVALTLCFSCPPTCLRQAVYMKATAYPGLDWGTAGAHHF